MHKIFHKEQAIIGKMLVFHSETTRGSKELPDLHQGQGLLIHNLKGED